MTLLTGDPVSHRMRHVARNCGRRGRLSRLPIEDRIPWPLPATGALAPPTFPGDALTAADATQAQSTCCLWPLRWHAEGAAQQSSGRGGDPADIRPHF